MANRKLYANRKYWILGIFYSVAIIYIVRLFFLQVIDEEWKNKSEANALRRIVTPAPRGIIYDRNGEKLVDNDISYDIMVVPRQVVEFDTMQLCQILEIDTATLNQRLIKARKYSPYVPSVFMKRVTPQMHAFLMERSHRFKGFYTYPRTVRKYHTTGAAHSLGYIAEVNYNDMEKDDYYAMGDYIGKSGIERSYEVELRGRKGINIVLVDARGREQGSFLDGACDTNAISGKSLWCSIDKGLQEYGEKLMQGKRGSIVAIEPQTGEILALVTSPTYDPSLLIGSERGENYLRLQNDSIEKPLFNRALMAQYPPGSTFKLVNALIFQQAGVVDNNTRYGCNYGFTYGNRKLGCHGHASPLNIAGSVQNSCNAWYCRGLIAMLDSKKVGKNTSESYQIWRDMVLRFGFGKKFENDLPYELTGFIPETSYYDRYYGKNRWRATTIISISIGQGEILATPMQLANLVAIIANRGYYYTPHIVKAIGDENIKNERFTEKKEVGVAPQYFAPVILGMENAVLAGTARRASVPGVKVCAKTGTAQNPHGKDHSLLVCFAPAENPKIAISVIVENGGFGATWAAPIASLMIEKYLKDTISRPDFEASVLGKINYRSQ